jgi:eukaryotic-like serine/threonine-protein kinase
VLAPGTTLARYVVETPLGSGGMGAVYRARDTHLDRAVALKVLSDGAGGLPDKEARERLVREARAAAALSHPNAVAIYDAGDSEHGPFIVMELIEGETLRGAISRGPSATSIVGWMKMAALALGDAHERGIVHRDIKPENLMLRRDGIAKVLDFGIARHTSKAQDPSAPTHAALPTLTGTGVQIGTPQYMAPEQIKGKKLDGRTDQFAWAVTAYEALAGRLPWQAENGALGVVASILEEVPPPVDEVRPEVPHHVGLVIARAMAKKPDDRFASMHDLVRALDGQPAEAPEAPAPNHVSVRPPKSSSPLSLQSETRFSEQTMKAVIGKALAFQERGGYSRGELREAALELGISEEALASATQAVRVEKHEASREDEARARILLRRQRGFRAHLIPYLCTLGIIAVTAGAQGHWQPVVIVALSWGIGLAIHGMKALSKHISSADLRKEIEREDVEIAKHASRRAALAEKLEKKQRRHEKQHPLPKQPRVPGQATPFDHAVDELSHAFEDGAARVLSAAAQKIRAGVGVSARDKQQAPASQERVRVQPPSTPPASGPHDTERMRNEAQAESEANAAMPSPRRRDVR